MSTRERALPWLAGLLVAFALVSLHQLVRASLAHDFQQFWAMGRYLAADPGAEIYAPITARAAARAAAVHMREHASVRGQRAAARNRELYAQGVEPISSPFYYAIFAALSSPDFDRDVMRFQTLSLAGFALAVFFSCRALGYSRTAAALALGVVGILFGPLHADVQTGNVNRLQIAWVACVAALQWRLPGRAGPLCAGLALAAAVAFKPNLAAVPACAALLGLIDRRGRDGVAAGAGFALGAVAVALTSGSGWGDWWAALGRYGSVPASIEQTNWSTATLLFEATGVRSSVVLGALLVASFAACAWRGRSVGAGKPPNRSREMAALAAALLAPLIASPLAWDHYFVLAIPAVLLCLRPARCATLFSAAGAAALFVCGRGPLEAIHPLEPASLATAFAIATATLWVAVLAELAGCRRGPGSTQSA